MTINQEVVRVKIRSVSDELASCGNPHAMLSRAGSQAKAAGNATDDLFLKEASAKLNHPNIQAIFVTDTIAPKETDWQQLQVVCVCPVMTTVIQRFKTNGSISDLLEKQGIKIWLKSSVIVLRQASC